VVFPGVIDVHLHLGHGRDIARPRVPEDAASETAAAAAGGVTTMIPYLMATEPFEAIFDDVRAVTEAGALIDFSYHFIIATEAQLAAVPRYVRDMGVPSFKIFMNNRGGEGKGRIAAGFNADIAIVDVRAEHTPRRDNLKSSAGYSIYEGVPLRGRVRHTLVGGRFALRNNELVADAIGTGRFIPRQAGG
jgi:dihydroorotase-like cyclic amidohydrolase